MRVAQTKVRLHERLQKAQRVAVEEQDAEGDAEKNDDAHLVGHRRRAGRGPGSGPIASCAHEMWLPPLLRRARTLNQGLRD